MRKGGRKRLAVILLMVLILMLWAVPFAKNEVLTARYGAEFEQELETGLFPPEELGLYKVIAYRQTTAKVYCVAEGNAWGALLHFARTEETGWQMESWETVWSKSGSAAGMLWPYFWYYSL